VIDGVLEAIGLSPDQCRLRPVSGGDINDAFCLEAGGGRTFLKVNSAPPPGLFEREAEGLQALRVEGGVAVPEVLSFGPSHLQLTWIEPGAPARQTARRLGEGLARLHEQTSPLGFGWPQDNWLGTLPQRNGWVRQDEGGVAFFVRRRLWAQAEVPGCLLPVEVLRLLELFCGSIERFLPEQGEAPALLHGDLWGGNWLSDQQGTPWLFDPAVAYGCREAELAFTHLFGGFPRGFYEAYESIRPLSPGHRERQQWWNLHPLLVHANLFGGHWIEQAHGVLRRAVG